MLWRRRWTSASKSGCTTKSQRFGVGSLLLPLRTVWTVKFGGVGGRFGFGGWVLGWKCGFGGVGPWNGKLFHVEQFEKGRNDEGFGLFLTVTRTVRDGDFYGATDGGLR